MKASEIRLHGVASGRADIDQCQWCGASLDADGRQMRAEPRYTIDDGRRLLVEVELWACEHCAGQSAPLSDADRADLQRQLDEMTPPRVGACQTCGDAGELFPHFDHDVGEEFLICERCFFDVP
jgi:hypothetical protein